MGVKDIDSHKLMYHPVHISKWMNNELTPLAAEIGITNKCNHNCVFCILDWTTHGVDNINKDIMMKCLKDMAEMGVKSTYYAGDGEPTLHKNLADFISYGKSLGMSQAIATNGSLFNKELANKILKDLSWLRFSVDAGTREEHSNIHGVSINAFDKILENIKNCVEIKKENKYSLDIGVQLILMPENINGIETLAKWCKAIGVDNLQIKPAQDHPKSSFTPVSERNFGFAKLELDRSIRYLKDDKFSIIIRTESAKRIIEERTYSECHALNFYINLDAKGNITPCNIFFNENDYIFGNLYENTFKEIWHSHKRKAIIKNIEHLKFCNCKEYRCRLDVLNRYLERIKHPERNDEFI